MERYLTVDECAAELRITPKTVRELVRKKVLAAVQTASFYRILDPSPALREQLLESRLERVPFISPHEVAEILDMSFVNVKWHMDTGRIKAGKIEGGPHFKVLSIKELRRFAATRAKRNGPGRLVYSPLIVKWLRGHLAKDANVSAEAIQEMLDKAVKFPEPKKSQVVVEIWALIDRLSEILR